MSASPSHTDLPMPDAMPARTVTYSRTSDFVTLTKPRLNLLVLITTMAAYFLGARQGISISVLLNTLVGTALVAGGASALNQVWERDTDRLMRRTRRRPLPTGRLHPDDAKWFGVAIAAIGFAQLALFVNPLTALVALATLVSYVWMYTPLKTRTSLSTIVGAIPGALPAVIGWAAATSTLSFDGWVLFGIVFLWQMPHFLAIAWLYRDEYASAGMPMLPVIHPDGRSTGRQTVLYAAGLLPFSLVPSLTGLVSPSYMFGAVTLGTILLFLSIEFAASRSLDSARRLFYGSILYLPLLWLLLVIDRLTH